MIANLFVVLVADGMVGEVVDTHSITQVPLLLFVTVELLEWVGTDGADLQRKNKDKKNISI